MPAGMERLMAYLRRFPSVGVLRMFADAQYYELENLRDNMVTLIREGKVFVTEEGVVNWLAG